MKFYIFWEKPYLTFVSGRIFIFSGFIVLQEMKKFLNNSWLNCNQIDMKEVVSVKHEWNTIAWVKSCIWGIKFKIY